jgi:ketosteroid isomerase-like protein
MSQQNVDALREAIEAYNRHDLGPDFSTELREVRALGDLTFAELRNRGRGAAGGTPVEQESWHVARWRDGKVVWWGAYATEAQALEAAGPGE